MEDRGRLRLLLDTNILLEILLERQNALQARGLLSQDDKHDFFISDYALHSIGNALFRDKAHAVFGEFLDDMILAGRVKILSLPGPELKSVGTVSQKYKLDFDDAYQYRIAEKNDLTLVSFDKDFDRTDQGRKTPDQILKK